MHRSASKASTGTQWQCRGIHKRLQDNFFGAWGAQLTFTVARLVFCFVRPGMLASSGFPVYVRAGMIAGNSGRGIEQA